MPIPQFFLLLYVTQTLPEGVELCHAMASWAYFPSTLDAKVIVVSFCSIAAVDYKKQQSSMLKNCWSAL